MNKFKNITLLVIVGLLFFGCSTEKKNQQALDRVLGSRALIDKVAPEVNKLYPCVPTEVKVGQNDTAIVVFEDTAQLSDLRQKLANTAIVKEMNIDSVKSALIAQIKPIITIKTITRVDTIADNQKIAILDTQIANDEKIHIQDIETVATQASVLQSAQSANKKYIGALICFAVIVFGYASYKIYSGIKPL